MIAGRIAAIVAVVAACGGSAGDSPSDPFDELPVWTLAEEPDLRIGRFDGPDEYTFAGVRDAALLGDSLLAVADRGSAEIRLYGLDGSFVRALGGPGSGPGEFESLGPISLGNGTVSAWDYRHQRLSTFRLTGELVGSITWRAPPGDGFPWFVGLAHDGTGFAALVGGGDHETMMDRREGRFRETAVYARCGLDGSCETVFRGLGDERTVSRGDHGYRIFPAFLGRSSVATVLGGRLVVGTTDSLYLERVAADGSREPFVRYALPPRPFTDADWDAYREKTARARDSARARGMPAFVEVERPPHATYPPFELLRSGADGNLWVGTYDPRGQLWWIFDAAGGSLGRLVSSGPQLLSLDTARVVALEREELGVESVVVYRVERANEEKTR